MKYRGGGVEKKGGWATIFMLKLLKLLKKFRIFEKHRKILKLNVIENGKFASRCQIASGLYGPLHTDEWVIPAID